MALLALAVSALTLPVITTSNKRPKYLHLHCAKKSERWEWDLHLGLQGGC